MPSSRVATWYIFKPKIPILVYFGGPYIYVMENVGIFYAQLDILWSFGTFFPVLVFCTKKKSGNSAFKM
jgi:hypothetical protein